MREKWTFLSNNSVVHDFTLVLIGLNIGTSQEQRNFIYFTMISTIWNIYKCVTCIGYPMLPNCNCFNRRLNVYRHLNNVFCLVKGNTDNSKWVILFGIVRNYSHDIGRIRIRSRGRLWEGCWLHATVSCSLGCRAGPGSVSCYRVCLSSLLRPDYRGEWASH